MAEIVYGGHWTDGALAQVTGMGQQNGPPGGDGWQIVARLPAAQLPQSSSVRLAVICRGRIGTIQRSGSLPQRGLAQLCLGTTFGMKSPHHLFTLAIREEEGSVGNPLDGFAFFFMMVQSSSPSIIDPSFGATWNNLAGSEICLWARAFWNGDTPAYAASFEVTGVQWLWFNLDAIPSTDQLAEDYRPSPRIALTTSTTDLYLNLNSPGSSGQKWLHFFRVLYQPRAFAQAAPWFQFGYSNTPGSFVGFSAKVGTNQRWGQNRAGLYGPGSGPQEPALLHQGGFWYQAQPSGTFLPAVRCADRFNGVPFSAQTLVHRYTYLGIRLDNLLDVLTATETEAANAASNFNNTSAPWWEVYVPLERPATGIVSLPSVFVHGIVQAGAAESHGVCIGTERALFHFCDGFCYVDPSRFEGMSICGWRDTPFSPTAPDVQLRAHFVGGLWNPNAVRNVRDITIATAYLTRDPEVLPTGPGATPDPVAVEPGREGPSIASLQAAPIMHDARIDEDWIQPEQARIDGATGYARTWPMFLQPRRTFRLQWTVRKAQVATIVDFLHANPTFKLTPPEGGSMVAVLQTGAVEVGWTDALTARVAVPVAELIFVT